MDTILKIIAENYDIGSVVSIKPTASGSGKTYIMEKYIEKETGTSVSIFGYSLGGLDTDIVSIQGTKTALLIFGIILSVAGLAILAFYFYRNYSSSQRQYNMQVPQQQNYYSAQNAVPQTTMAICPSCGQAKQNSDAFCNKCGARFT